MHFPTIDLATLGDQRIAAHVKKLARRLRLNELDREDFSQDVHAELCVELGCEYREKCGVETLEFWSTAEGKMLNRCAERVRQRLRRSWQKLRFQSLGDLCPDIEIEPDTVADSIAKELSEIGEALPANERLILNLLRDGHTNEYIQDMLQIKRSTFFCIRNRLYSKLNSKLTLP